MAINFEKGPAKDFVPMRELSRILGYSQGYTSVLVRDLGIEQFIFFWDDARYRCVRRSDIETIENRPKSRTEYRETVLDKE